MVDRTPEFVPKAGLQAGDAKKGVIFREGLAQLLDGTLDGFRFEKRIGAVGLQVEVGWHLGSVVDQDLIGGGGVGTQFFRAQQHFHLRVVPRESFNNWRGIGVHHHLADRFNAQEGLDNVRVKRFTAHQAVILSGHTLGVVAHG